MNNAIYMKAYMRILGIMAFTLFISFGCKKENIVEDQLYSKQIQAAQRIPYNEDLTEDALNELLILSDTTTLHQVPDLGYRLNRIAEIFISFDDKRGTFPAVYSATTQKAIESLQSGLYQDTVKAIGISVAFGKRYLKNLHAHLLGLPIEYHWKKFYDLACDSSQHIMRAATSGINAHLTVDLERSVMDIKGNGRFKADYALFGEALVLATPDIIQNLKEGYEVDSYYLFHGLFIGDILDAHFGDGYTTQLAFKTIRAEAWINGLLLQNTATYAGTQKALQTNFRSREIILNNLDKSGYLE